MHLLRSPDSFSLRQATQADDSTIRHIIHQAGINPLGLAWQRFVLAIDPAGELIGCGQVKPHLDGSIELASIAVLPEWRGKGVARKIIEHLLEQYPGELYLTCRSSLGVMYEKFGFKLVQRSEMPSYFRRLSKMVALFNMIYRQPESMLVMRRN